MHNHEYQYVENKLQIASSNVVNQTIWLCCTIFALFSFVYPIAIIIDYLDYGMIQDLDIVFIIINLVSGLGFIGSLINLFLFLYFGQSILRYVRHLAMMTLFAIPGLITLFLGVANPPLLYKDSIALPFIIFLLISMGFVFLGYQVKRVRLRTAKTYRGSKSYSLFLYGFIALMTVGIGMKALPFEHISMYANLGVMFMLLLFLSIWVGQMFLAASLITKFRQDFIYFENIPYDARLHEANRVAQRRLLILAPIYHETALDVLEEFGFARQKVDAAIHAKQPIYTFVEGTRLDFEFLQRLLERLCYEDITFVVEEEKNHEWIALDKAFHEQVTAKNMHYVKQVTKQKEIAGRSWLVKVIFFVPFLIIKSIYVAWICIFPVNYFMPVSAMSENQIKKCYDAFTYYNLRTLTHGIFMIFCVMIFFISPEMQAFSSQMLHGEDDVLPIVFILVFVVELFVFAIYLKRLKRVIDKTTRVHNHDKNVIYIALVLIVFRIYKKGWQLALVQISVLFVAIELAKFFIIVYRFICNLKKTNLHDGDENCFFEDFGEEKLEKI